MPATVSLTDTIDEPEVLALYAANRWSSAQKPRQLLAALRGSHGLVTARIEGMLVGLGNAIYGLRARGPHRADVGVCGQGPLKARTR